jgi:ribosome-associated toxin RatA of RatAB toxin-antitoxin module
MYIENTIVLRGNWADIWRYSSQIEHWVEWLPHYRKIEIFETFENGRKRRAYMSCWRDLLPLRWKNLDKQNVPVWIDWLRIPESWKTVQTLQPNDNPAQARILYNHIGGPTKGMEVIWSFEPLGNDYYRVSISHNWRAKWPLIGGVATYLIQTQIVHDIADKTLATMKRRVAEASDSRNVLSRAAL